MNVAKENNNNNSNKGWKYLKEKEELWKIQLFHHAKKFNLPKKSPKRNQNPKSFKILL
jgi:hypothetical protein